MVFPAFERVCGHGLRDIGIGGEIPCLIMWDIIPIRSLSEIQFWCVVAGVALTPMITFGIADGIGWFLRRALLLRQRWYLSRDVSRCRKG
jgi:hypothetical protein